MTSDYRDARAQLIRRHVDAENRGDMDEALTTFLRPRYDVVPLGTPNDGEEAVRDLWATILGAFPDFHVALGKLHHSDDAVFVEIDATGTHNGAWAGIEPTGRPINVRMGCLFEFEGEQLVNETVYFDHATLLSQIGSQ